MASYIALLRKDAESDFGVDFPDFPGCVTAGGTLEEARTMAAEALAGHIACMIDDGEEIPEPSSLDAIMNDPEYVGALPFLVTVPDPNPRAVRVNITLSENLLRRIDAFVKSGGMTRSGFLARAAEQAMATDQQPR